MSLFGIYYRHHFFVVPLVWPDRPGKAYKHTGIVIYRTAFVQQWYILLRRHLVQNVRREKGFADHNQGMLILPTSVATHFGLFMLLMLQSLPAGILKAPWMISARFVGATGTAWKLQSEHCYRLSCIKQPCQIYLDICTVFGSHAHCLRL